MSHPNKIYLEPTLVKDHNGNVEYRIVPEGTSGSIPYVIPSTETPMTAVVYEDTSRLRAEMQYAYMTLSTIAESELIRFDQVLFKRALDAIQRLKSVLTLTPRK